MNKLRITEILAKKKSILIYFIVLTLAGCSTTPVKVDIPASPSFDEKASSTMEKQIGYAGYYYVLLNYKLVDDPQNLNRINRIGARLSYYTERPNIKYKYFIIDSEYREAFSVPDGYIFLTNSLINTMESDEKIAAIIAHEIAHITHKHAVERYSRLKGYNPARSILGQDVFIIATELGYNKAYELQADQTSLRYLYRSGYDLNAAVSILEKLKQIEKEDEVRFKESQKDKKDKKDKKELLIDHPYIENRIVNLKNYLGEIYRTEKIKYNEKDFNF